MNEQITFLKDFQKDKALLLEIEMKLQMLHLDDIESSINIYQINTFSYSRLWRRW
jgi:hypothetical protein